MYIAIVITGLAIFVVALLRYWRIHRVIDAAALTRVVEKAEGKNNFIVELYTEWRNYAFGSVRWGINGFIISLTLLLLSLFINYYYLGFPWVFFILTVCVVLVIAQIRMGRAIRKKYFENKFPEVLTVVSSAISAGNSIQQALERCGTNIDGDMGNIFNNVSRRLNLGEEPERVFNDAVNIYRYREFYFFFIVMMVSLQRGGQLRTLISRLSRTININKNMDKRKKAMTSEARASAKIVAAIPVIFFLGMKFLSPDNFDFIVNDSTGRYILYYVLSSEVVGLLIINHLVRKAI
jgi:tight adherence protein B